MKNSRRSLTLFAAFAAAILFLGQPTRTQAQTEIVLHHFTGGRDGAFPNGALNIASDGNIYGTAEEGGDLSACSGTGCGVVFKLSPTSTGGWAETVLFTFDGKFHGGDPGAGVIRDQFGNLYGTAFTGGLTKSGCQQKSCGVVFKLSPNSSGGWKEKVLYAFQGGTDGSNPAGGLVMDASGNLYGTTFGGGSGDEGIAFKLSPTTSGFWTETILASFTGDNGANPNGSLLIDAAGNLYGTAPFGGSSIQGIVFELSPGSGGTWTETILYNFASPPDVENPFGALAMDASGNLYGTAEAAGAAKFYGGIFELTHASSAPWPETVLYSFTNGSDGENPFANAVFDGSGNLFATATFGGSNGCGALIELSPSSSGWTENTLLDFDCTHGQTPANVSVDASGNVYGVTLHGGSHGFGVAYEVKP